MDPIMLDLLEEIEEAEIDENARVPIQEARVLLRNPFHELTDNQFRRMFRLSRCAFEYVTNMLRPHLTPQLRPTDLGVEQKVRSRE